MNPEPTTTIAALAARVDALEKALNREVALICKLGEERDGRYTERWGAQQRETDLARVSISDRLDKMNEIREQLNKQAATFLTREQAELLVAKALAQAQGDTARAAAELAADLARAVTLAETQERRLGALEHRADVGYGKDTGTLSARALLFSVVAAAGAIIGIVVGVINLFGN